MPLSSDRLNGHPTSKDPDPKKRAAIRRGFNGYPQARAKQAEKKALGPPADQIRRIEQAAAAKERSIKKLRTERFLEIYEIPMPTKAPGKKTLFSRWLKEQGDKKFNFPDLDTFVAYVQEHHGTAEKDANYQVYLDEAEPNEEAEETLARETQEALDRVDTQKESRPLLPTNELPPKSYMHELGI